MESVLFQSAPLWKGSPQAFRKGFFQSFPLPPISQFGTMLKNGFKGMATRGPKLAGINVAFFMAEQIKTAMSLEDGVLVNQEAFSAGLTGAVIRGLLQGAFAGAMLGGGASLSQTFALGLAKAGGMPGVILMFAKSMPLFAGARFIFGLTQGEGFTVENLANSVMFGTVAAFFYVFNNIMAMGATEQFSRLAEARGLTIEQATSKVNSFGGFFKTLFSGDQLTQAYAIQNMFRVAEFMVTFNAFNKAMIQPLLSIVGEPSGGIIGWLYNSFEQFGKATIWQTEIMGLQFGFMMAPLGALSARAEQAFSRFVKGLGVSASPEGSGLVAWFKQMLQATTKEGVVEQAASGILTSMGVPPQVAEMIVELIPDGVGGVAQGQIQHLTYGQLQAVLNGSVETIELNGQEVKAEDLRPALHTAIFIQLSRAPPLRERLSRQFTALKLDTETSGIGVQEYVKLIRSSQFQAYLNKLQQKIKEGGNEDILRREQYSVRESLANKTGLPEDAFPVVLDLIPQALLVEFGATVKLIDRHHIMDMYHLKKVIGLTAKEQAWNRTAERIFNEDVFFERHEPREVTGEERKEVIAKIGRLTFENKELRIFDLGKVYQIVEGNDHKTFVAGEEAQVQPVEKLNNFILEFREVRQDTKNDGAVIFLRSKQAIALLDFLLNPTVEAYSDATGEGLEEGTSAGKTFILVHLAALAGVELLGYAKSVVSFVNEEKLDDAVLKELLKNLQRKYGRKYDKDFVVVIRSLDDLNEEMLEKLRKAKIVYTAFEVQGFGVGRSEIKGPEREKFREAYSLLTENVYAIYDEIHTVTALSYIISVLSGTMEVPEQYITYIENHIIPFMQQKSRELLSLYYIYETEKRELTDLDITRAREMANSELYEEKVVPWAKDNRMVTYYKGSNEISWIKLNPFISIVARDGSGKKVNPYFTDVFLNLFVEWAGLDGLTAEELRNPDSFEYKELKALLEQWARVNVDPGKGIGYTLMAAEDDIKAARPMAFGLVNSDQLFNTWSVSLMTYMAAGLSQEKGEYSELSKAEFKESLPKQQIADKSFFGTIAEYIEKVTLNGGWNVALSATQGASLAMLQALGFAVQLDSTVEGAFRWLDKALTDDLLSGFLDVSGLSLQKIAQLKEKRIEKNEPLSVQQG